MDLDELVKGLLGELGKVSKSDAVVGTVRDAGRAKVMPLSKISIGFGAASLGASSKAAGERPADAGAEGGGVGGALVVEPKAFVVVGEDGVPHMLALKRGKAAVLRRGIEIHSDGRLAQLPGSPAKALPKKADPESKK
ncbi:MAG: hypothetical protein IT376_18455 [Polyangiaceae bacterium]|nr:hypothetical protein [Polyangiaceae bacterium]